MTKEYITPHRASRILGVHRQTVYRWVDCALHDEPSPLRNVRRANNGRIEISHDDVVSFVREKYAYKKQ